MTARTQVAVQAIQWVWSDDAEDEAPNDIVNMLALPGGQVHGFDRGPAGTTRFGTEHGDLVVEPGQWIAKHADGTFSVWDTDPLKPRARTSPDRKSTRLNSSHWE